eukprot:sb/3469014/
MLVLPTNLAHTEKQKSLAQREVLQTVRCENATTGSCGTATVLLCKFPTYFKFCCVFATPVNNITLDTVIGSRSEPSRSKKKFKNLGGVSLNRGALNRGPTVVSSNPKRVSSYLSPFCHNKALNKGCVFASSGSNGLGEVSTAVLEDKEGSLSLTYTDGDLCSSVPNEKYSAHITFLCAEDDITGTPQYISNSTCRFLFLWTTKYACKDRISSDSCIIKDAISGATLLNLTSVKGEYTFNSG